MEPTAKEFRTIQQEHLHGTSADICLQKGKILEGSIAI